MADTLTANYAWTLPEPGASADTWGTKWNANFATAVTGVDAIVKGISNVANAAAVKANNLSDLGSAATARTNLGLVIGTNVQAYHLNLAALAGLSIVANTLPYGNGTGTMGLATLTAFARTILDDTDASASRTTLGLGSLSTLSTINGSNWSGTDLAVADGGTGASDVAAARSNLGLVIGTNVQAFNANLAAVAGLTLVADRLPYADGSGTLALATLTAAGRALVDDATAADQRTTLGLGTAAVQNVAAFAQSANNLSDLANATTARTNLGLGTAAVQNVAAFLQPSNNLSDLSAASTARTNLGLGTSATINTGTSGAVIPKLDGANTWSGAQALPAASTVDGKPGPGRKPSRPPRRSMASGSPAWRPAPRATAARSAGALRRQARLMRAKST
jgi:hypothetical protein